MNIGLIGYRAAGKSTLGQLLSSRLSYPFLDVDRGIEQQSGKTIKALYEEDGATLLTLLIEYPDAATRDMVLATGMIDGMETSYQRLEGMLVG